MTKPRLPSRPEETWDGGFLLEQPREVRAVDARAGLVVAGGADLYLLRPGEENIKHRPPPLDIGPVHLAAAEPRGERRYAFASQAMLALFLRRNKEDQILRIRPQGFSQVATHLAWGGTKGACGLWVRWDDAQVSRLRPDLSDIDTFDLPPMLALAADDNGVVAMISSEDVPKVYVAREDENMHFRALGRALPDQGPVHLAVADGAVAVSLGDGEVLLSRGDGDPFRPCEPLLGAGPLAFEGSARDAALFGAVSKPSLSWITRVDRAGEAMRTVELGAEGGPPLEIVAITWDAQRHKLWGATPQAGLFTSIAPSAKKGKRVMS